MRYSPELIIGACIRILVFQICLPGLIISICPLGSFSQPYVQNISSNHPHIEWVSPRPFWKVSCMDFCDAKNGWAAGRMGMLIHTSDGGRTWEQQFTGWDGRYQYVISLDAKTCILMDDGHNIVKTNDGGKRWYHVFNVEQGRIRYVQKTDDSVVFCMTNGSSNILKSTDGGETWETIGTTSVTNEDGKQLYISSMHFFDRDNGWARINNQPNTFVETRDGGKSWKPFHTKVIAKLPAASAPYYGSTNWETHFLSPSHAYFFSSKNCDSVAISRNKGKKWKWINISGNRKGKLVENVKSFIQKKRLGFDKKGPMKILDKTGQLIWVGGSDWNEECLSKPVYFFLNDSLGWMAVEDERLLAYTRDGGKTWINSIERNPITDIRDMVMPKAGTVLIIGGDNERNSRIPEPCLIKTVDEGKTWQSIPILNKKFASSICFYGNQGWLTVPELQHGPTYKENKVYKSQDWGQNWSHLSTLPKLNRRKVYYSTHCHCCKEIQHTASDLATKSISFLDSTLGLQQIDLLRYYTTTNGGKNWQVLPLSEEDKVYEHSPLQKILGYDKNLSNLDREVSFLKPGTFVMANRTLSRSENAGKAWKTTLSSTADYRHIYFYDQLNGWAWEHPEYRSENFEGLRMLAHTSNGGKTWEEFALKFPQRIRLLKFFSPKEGWAIKNEVRHTENGGQTWQTVKELEGLGITSICQINKDEVWFGGRDGIVKWKR